MKIFHEVQFGPQAKSDLCRSVLFAHCIVTPHDQDPLGQRVPCVVANTACQLERLLDLNVTLQTIRNSLKKAGPNSAINLKGLERTGWLDNKQFMHLRDLSHLEGWLMQALGSSLIGGNQYFD